MKEIYAQTRIARREIATAKYASGSGLREAVTFDLARSLATEILKFVSLREEVDPATGDLIVRATVSVAEPGDTMGNAYGVSPVDSGMKAMEVKIGGRREGAKFVANVPQTLMAEKMMAAMEQIKDDLRLPAFTMIPMPPPIEFFSTRMLRKKAMLEGEASAVVKARGEKEVRENTKKRGPTIQIEVGVRKITMPEPKKESAG